MATYLMTLQRNKICEGGVFGALTGNQFFAVTLEHAFSQSDGSFAPVIPAGTYICVRGMHQLKGMNEPFETFEITGVSGHSGLLFHVGNTNKDSSGCVLLGGSIGPDMICNSRAVFDEFMASLQGEDSFQLTVV